jgi:hypothetical protein
MMIWLNPVVSILIIAMSIGTIAVSLRDGAGTKVAVYGFLAVIFSQLHILYLLKS